MTTSLSFCLAALFFSCSSLPAMPLQSAAALFLCGASSREDLDSGTVESLDRLSRRPLLLNSESESGLRSCGLFSAYQIASLLEYRRQNGDILSFGELGRLDGWSTEFAEALREFVSLESRVAPGQSSSGSRFRGDLCLRYASNGYMGKIDAGSTGRWEVFLSSKTGNPLNASASLYGRRSLGKIIIGAYNARFGQGLVRWSGMTTSGFGTVDALCRRASGLSICTSASDRSDGLAADFCFGKWTVSAAGGVKFAGNQGRIQLDALVNVSHLGPGAQWGLTASFLPSQPFVSADYRGRAGKADIFGEAAWDFRNSAPAAVLGVRADPEYQVCWSVAARYYSPKFDCSVAAGPRASSKTSDEAGLCAAYRRKWLQCTLDAVYFQNKSTAQGKFILTAAPAFKAGGLSLKPGFRISLTGKALRTDEGFKPDSHRSDLRVEIDSESGPWRFNARWNGLWAKGFGNLAYIEGAFVNKFLTLWMRGGVFRIDNWDDRIYVYERDVNGSFNVPAYYGRGWNASLYGSFSFESGRRAHKLGLRAAAVSCRREKERADKLEWRLQYSFSW